MLANSAPSNTYKFHSLVSLLAINMSTPNDILLGAETLHFQPLSFGRLLIKHCLSHKEIFPPTGLECFPGQYQQRNSSKWCCHQHRFFSSVILGEGKDMNTNQENLVRKMVRSFRSSWKTGISSSVDKELHDYECKHFISCYLYGRYYLGNTTKWKHFIIYSGLLSVSLKPSNCWLLTSFMRIPLLNRTLDQILFSIALAQSPFLVAESP